MRKIILYIILIIILFSGFHQLKEVWQKNGKSLNGTFLELKKSLFEWYQSATEKGKVLKLQLDEKIKSANEKVKKIQDDINSIRTMMTQKNDQLQKSLKEIEEAKKALDELLKNSQNNNKVSIPSSDMPQ